MPHLTEREQIIAAIDLTAATLGPVLDPQSEPTDTDRRCFTGWATPLAPWGGWRLPSCFSVEKDDGRQVLALLSDPHGTIERALVADALDLRDGRIVAEVRPLAAHANNNADRHGVGEALAGVVFRWQTSRSYYQFAIEGRRRAVLLRRRDDEWLPLAEQPVEVPEGAYLTLEVQLDGDGIRATCEQLGVDLFATDTTFHSGKAGIRLHGAANVASVRILQTPAQKDRDDARALVRQNSIRRLGADIPDPVLIRTYDLDALGGSPTFCDFAEEGRFDLLVPTPTGLRALTPEGQVLWETPIDRPSMVEPSTGVCDEGRLLYVLAGERRGEEAVNVVGGAYRMAVQDEMLVLSGRTGQVLARKRIDVPIDEAMLRHLDWSDGTGNLRGGGAFDIVLREWRKDRGGGGIHLWAFDRELNLLWDHTIDTAWYGHHYAVAFADVNRDGRDELLAGGILLDASGQVLWTHDLAEEELAIPHAQHYDAVAVGDLADDDASDPVAFLLGGSSGCYVVDARTGRTRAAHRIGHAQGRFVGKLRDDIPGRQVVAATRWGNMGTLTLFTGRGERLWTIQPDYVGQGSCPVTWGSVRPQLLWTNTSVGVQGFHDGYGRRVKELTILQELCGSRPRRGIGSRPVRLGRAETDYLGLALERTLHVFGPA